jgi:hypothetical protein
MKRNRGTMIVSNVRKVYKTVVLKGEKREPNKTIMPLDKCWFDYENNKMRRWTVAYGLIYNYSMFNSGEFMTGYYLPTFWTYKQTEGGTLIMVSK